MKKYIQPQIATLSCFAMQNICDVSGRTPGDDPNPTGGPGGNKAPARALYV